MDFTQAVKQAMSKTDTKRADLARATGYSYQYISDLLAGKRRWHEVVINKTCEALGIKIEITCGTSQADEEKACNH